jgi:anti-sigma regulatory factor (Ser/Thr protein kinase)
VTDLEAMRLAVDLAHLTAVRHAVADFATQSGLRDRAQADFVLAVNELVTNAIRHGGGRGELRMRRIDRGVWCSVADRGPGLPLERRVNQMPLPPASDTGGRGLWLVHRLCDDVTITAGPEGTTISVFKLLP